jgi:GT2 family glycosyltransferase
MISIIVPTRDNLTDLKLCVTSVRSLTTYGNWELIIVDNGSVETPTHDYLRALAADPRIRVLRQDIPFNFARLNNIAVKESRGQYLLFLNNDTEVLSEDWLQQMLTFASQPHIGAVGARLLYPDGTLQHSGVARVGPGPTHVFQGMPESYEHPRVRLPGNWAAVTAACLMVAADKFAAVGGFDEAFPVGYNDVDLCYALLSRGYFNVLAPSARLIHKEFATRGNDRADAAKRAALEDALRRLDTKWPQFIQDPFYNPNLSDSFPDFMPRN